MIIVVKENGVIGKRETSVGVEGVLESGMASLRKWHLNGDLNGLRQEAL